MQAGSSLIWLLLYLYLWTSHYSVCIYSTAWMQHTHTCVCVGIYVWPCVLLCLLIWASCLHVLVWLLTCGRSLTHVWELYILTTGDWIYMCNTWVYITHMELHMTANIPAFMYATFQGSLIVFTNTNSYCHTSIITHPTNGDRNFEHSN